MFGFLEAQTDRLVNQAQALFRLPELGWLESIQSEVEQPNPAHSLENVLSDILSRQSPEQDSPYQATAEVLAPSRSTTPTFSRARSAKPSHDNSMFTVDKGQGGAPAQLREADVLSPFSKEISPFTETLAGIVDAVPTQTSSTRGKTSTVKHGVSQQDIQRTDSVSSFEKSQSTRLLTGVGELHNLLSALPREASGQPSSKTSTARQTDKSAVSEQDRGANTAGRISRRDDVSAISSQANIVQSRTEINNYQQTRPSSSASKLKNNDLLSSLESEREQNGAQMRVRAMPDMQGEVHHSGNSSITSDTFTSSLAGGSLKQVSPPNSCLSGTDRSPLVEHQQVHTDAEAQVTLDNATLELLLEELLDRLEERQRDTALRTLGLTGGQL